MAELPPDRPRELPLDVAAIVKLATRGGVALDDLADGVRRPTPRLSLRQRSAELSIVAAARLAAQRGAIGLVPDVRRWAHASIMAEEPISIVHALREALTVSIRDGVPPELLEPLLPELDDWLLVELAKALDPEREGDLGILQRLADHPRAEVADAAHGRLGPRRAYCWYAGIFEHDPIAAHAGEPTVVAALERARAALGRERPGARPGEVWTLCAAADALPPALAIPLLEASLRVFPSAPARPARTGDADDELDDLDALDDDDLDDEPPTEHEGDAHDDGPVARLYALGGLDAVVQALERLAETHGNPERALARVASWCSVLPEDARIALALRVLPWVDPPSSRDDAAVRSPKAARDEAARPQGAAHLVAALWPRTASPMPLVEWLVEHQLSHTYRVGILKAAIEEAAELASHADRLLELAVAHPRLSQELSAVFRRLGSVVPPAKLAAMVEVALGSGHDPLRRWALEQKTGRLAPADPDERHAWAEAWLDDPAARKTILGSERCRARLLPWLRRRLRAGTLSLAEANATMADIGRLYGGVLEPRSWELRGRRSSELEAAERRAAARAALGVWTDPPGGPPTAQEWANLRALARRALEVVDRPPWEVLAVRPVGPWSADDLALLDAIEARAVPAEPLGAIVLHHLQGVLEGSPPPDAAARARRVLAVWEGDPALAEEWRDVTALRRLAEGAAPQSDAPTPPTEAPDWMDQDDEELDP